MECQQLSKLFDVFGKQLSNAKVANLLIVHNPFKHDEIRKLQEITSTTKTIFGPPSRSDQ